MCQQRAVPWQARALRHLKAPRIHDMIRGLHAHAISNRALHSRADCKAQHDRVQECSHPSTPSNKFIQTDKQ